MGAVDHEDLTTMGLFFETHAGLKAAFERRLEAECNVPVQWFEVLLRLARSPEGRLRMSDLAAQSSVTPSGLTRVVDRMADAGLVTREPCPGDRRAWYAVLTPLGRARMEEAIPHHLAQIQELVRAVLTPEEVDAFASILRKLRDQFNPCAVAGIEAGGGCY